MCKLPTQQVLKKNIPMKVDDFTKAGFTVVSSEEKENNLLKFLKEHYPSVIKDNELNINELKSLLGLPINEKVNGYGLNFVGRGFARAKYAQKTKKEVHLNKSLSKNIDETQNLVIKGDNLDSLKILKNYYRGKIKCIYIDPPYNTANDEFVYPDKFDKEEAEVLGFANLSDDDFDRLDFSFKTKKSHNGWLSFMYPRLLLARDLLSDDGVIFISIDDNEQANLKLLCDDVFGEENCVNSFIWKRNSSVKTEKDKFTINTEYVLLYSKTRNFTLKDAYKPLASSSQKLFKFDDGDGRGKYQTVSLQKPCDPGPETTYNYVDNIGKVWSCPSKGWRMKFEKIKALENDGRLVTTGKTLRVKDYWNERKSEGKRIDTLWNDLPENTTGSSELEKILGVSGTFNNPKPLKLISRCLEICDRSAIILDFFAGSGTTGHAVMELNKEDGGSRKFILCQIDEPIKKDKPAYKFCIENDLPPVVSSITIERLRRVGKKIEKGVEEKRGQNSLFNATLTTPPPRHT